MKELENKKNYAGFTLLEAIVSLLILGGICFLISSLMSYTKQIQPILARNEEKQWHIFLIQFEKEFKKYEFKKTEPNRVLFYHTDKKVNVVFENKQNKIVKVENGGYQPLLMNVYFAKFQQNNQELVLNIEFQNKKKYCGKWRLPIQNEEAEK